MLTDAALLPTFLMLLSSVLGALTLASVVGVVLKHKVARGAPHAVIDNLNSRNKAWWVMILIGTGAFVWGKTGVVILFSLLSFMALREYTTVAGHRPCDRAALIGLFYLVLPLQYLWVWLEWEMLSLLFIPVGVFAVLPVVMLVQGQVSGYLEHVAKMQWGAVMAVYCLSHVPALLTLGVDGFEGRQILLVIFLVMVVQLADVLQYVCGKLLGRRLTAPRWSPSKTVEGLVGGIAGASLIGAALSAITPFVPWQAGAVALALCSTGFLGGLVMSAIKRDRGVKDWGGLIGGHGGVLDRLDSVVLSAPAFYHLLRWWWVS
ncbi:phosphatidate cytidylyltransferase [Aquabacterium sp.]|uniref:phosphatidate cytidylyltransferase n=1 Tax=Aquabacterium sp. TaxID=1872578 RepID=UPI003D6CADF7